LKTREKEREPGAEPGSAWWIRTEAAKAAVHLNQAHPIDHAAKLHRQHTEIPAQPAS